MMCYDWKAYCSDDASLVDSWLDDYAIKETGLDEGWQSFYDYWMTESQTGEEKDRCYVIFHEGVPFAVMYITILNSEVIISEFIVAPNMRSRGHGTAVIKELTGNITQLLNSNASLIKAVIFPNNIASIKAFEKVGFLLVSENHDSFGESLNYEFNLSQV